MKKFCPVIFLTFFTGIICAQNIPRVISVTTNKAPLKKAPPEYLPRKWGVVDTADLKMTSCDFEKEAYAEILFDKGTVNIDYGKSMERHVRIKIFSEFGKRVANVRLLYHTEFLSGKGYSDIEGETINLEDGKIVKTPLDKSQIFTEKLNKNFSEIVFTLPNVKVGSIIEYKYNCFPQKDWAFQNKLPTRYSQFNITVPRNRYSFGLSTEYFTRQLFAEDTADVKNGNWTWALADVHSLPDEPFMTDRKLNLQRISISYFGFGGSWTMIANALMKEKGFDLSDDEKLPGQESILKRSDAYTNFDDKIAFLFDTVKKAMRWDNRTFIFSSSGLETAWGKKTGNSAEINLVLMHFLRVVGVNAYPMVVSTRGYGTVKPMEADPYAINNTVVYVPIDSTHCYVLDASDRYNQYNRIPENILNTYGIEIVMDAKKARTLRLSNEDPVRQSTYVDAQIKPDGKVNGHVQITSEAYDKARYLKLYDRLGEKNFIDSTFNLGNTVKVDSFKIANMTVDSLPLMQNLAFTADMSGAGDGYLYINTNLFSLSADNPFKSEQRFSDIDFVYRRNYTMNGIYHLPDGYKIESLPKSITIIMPDQSIVFKRTVAQDNGTVLIRYSVNHKKSAYSLAEYQELRGFYKQMYDLMNEQLILKKG